MSDIEAIRASIKELEQTRKEKVRKLKDGVKTTMEYRHTQREAQRRPT